MCSVQFHREDSSGSGFGSWKTVPAVPVRCSVPAKTVPAVPVSGSGSVPGPPCIFLFICMGGQRAEGIFCEIFLLKNVEHNSGSLFMVRSGLHPSAFLGLA